jgi:hypothetical protein
MKMIGDLKKILKITIFQELIKFWTKMKTNQPKWCSGYDYRLLT